MTEKERTTLLAEKSWTLGTRNDGQHAVWDSSGQQIGIGATADEAIAAAIETGKKPKASSKGK